MDDNGVTKKVIKTILDFSKRSGLDAMQEKYRGPKVKRPGPDAHMVKYTKRPDGSFDVQWSDGGATTQPPEDAERLHREIDMSAYGRSVDARKKSGAHPAMIDPKDAPDTPEREMYLEVSGGQPGETKERDDEIRSSADHFTAHKFASKAGLPSPDAEEEDEESLLARAGK